jgi:hypothetical protein
MKKIIAAFTVFIGLNTLLTIGFLQMNASQSTFDEGIRGKLFSYWEKDNLQTRNQLLAELRGRDLKTYKQLVTWNTDWNRSQAHLNNQYQLFSDRLFSLYFLSQKMNWQSLERGSFKLLKDVSSQSFRQTTSFDRYRTRLKGLTTLSADVKSNSIINKLGRVLTNIQIAKKENQRLAQLKGHLNPILLRSTINKQVTFPWTNLLGLIALQLLIGGIVIWRFNTQNSKIKENKTSTKRADDIANLPIQDINLTEITEQVLSDLSPIFQSKNLQVLFESSEEYMVKENKVRLSRTLNSLISDIALAVAPRSNDKTLTLQILRENESVILNTKIKDICLSQAVLFDPYTGNESNAHCLEESLEAFEQTTSGKVSVKNHYDPVDKSLFSNINLMFRA